MRNIMKEFGIPEKLTNLVKECFRNSRELCPGGKEKTMF